MATVADLDSDRIRMVVVANTPLPYHTPILNCLSDRVALHVIYMSRNHPLGAAGGSTGAYVDPWGEPPRFRYSFHWSWAVRLLRSDFRAQMSFGVSARLEALGPDVIMFSSWGPLMIEPLAWRLARRRRAIMWAESTAWSGLVRGSLSSAIRRSILRRVDAFVANGTEATRYLRELNAPAGRIVTSCLPSPIPAAAITPALSGPARRFLFVGRLIHRKRPLAAIEAFLRVLQEVPDATLTIVGEGPLSSEARRVAAPAAGSIRFAGRLEGSALVPEYVSADVLVVPSVREVWGLVVNEALAHGLFVIATDEVASAVDLLDKGSGAIVPVDDLEALRNAFLAATSEVDRDEGSRAHRRARIRHCTPDHFAEAIAEAIGIALKEDG